MTRLSLRLRLALAGAAAVLLALALAAAALAALFGAHVERRAMAELSVQLDQVIAGLEWDSSGRLVLARAPADPRFATPLGGLYWQIGGEGRVIRSRSLWDQALRLPPDELSTGAVHAHRLPGPAGEELLVLERSVTLPARLGGTEIRAAVAMDAAELAEARAAFVRDLAPYLGLLAVALILAGWVQLTVGLRPLAAVGAQVAAVRSGRAARLGSDFPAEVQPLAAEVDALIEARARDVEQARRRAGDLAHGLKTPLQALLGDAERLRRKGEPALAEGLETLARSMQRHIDRELTRARIATRAGSGRCEVAEIARRVASVARRTPAGSRLAWEIEVPPAVSARLDPEDLAEALGALVENAARHAEGAVVITAGRDSGRVHIEIRDDGRGIQPDRMESLMERGARADANSAGSGLGLAIAREIAEAAGGMLRLRSAGPGLIARLELPDADVALEKTTTNPCRPAMKP